MPRPQRRQPALDPAAALHKAAIRLLRRVRTADDASGLTAPRASALSVLVFGGPVTLGELARTEQVRPPTITRLVQDMEREGLVKVVPDAADRRIKRVHPTALGRRLMMEGRERRLRRVAAAVASLSKAERSALEQALPVLTKLSESV